jgi:hypothetical protein
MNSNVEDLIELRNGKPITPMGLPRRRGGEFNISWSDDTANAASSFISEKTPLMTSPTANLAAVDPASHIYYIRDTPMKVTVPHYFQSSSDAITDITSEQLDDILRFEERLRYNYIILKRIQFKYSVFLFFLMAWTVHSIVQVYIIGSRWHIRFLYVSCILIALFFIMGFYREKISRPAK